MTHSFAFNRYARTSSGLTSGSPRWDQERKSLSFSLHGIRATLDVSLRHVIGDCVVFTAKSPNHSRLWAPAYPNAQAA